MSDAGLRDLYQDIILDHGRKPRNFRRLESPTHQARGDNPLCGDRIDLYLDVRADQVADAAFIGRGCAISVASGSLMTEVLLGKTVAQARAMSDAFRMLAKTGTCPDCGADLEALAPLSGVHEFPSRVKCATLPWVTLNAALDRAAKEASSE